MRKYMTKQANEFKIDAVLEKKHHIMTSGGHGFGELIFSLTNVGEDISSSEVSMAIALPGQSDKHPLPFPEGVSIIKKGQGVTFNSTQPPLTRGSGAVIVLTRNTDGKEIGRAIVRDIP